MFNPIDIREVQVCAFLEGAIVALKKNDPDNIEDFPQFRESIQLTVKKYWNLPLYRDGLINTLKKFSVNFICFKCGGDIEQGQALDNTWIGFNDFGGDTGQPGTTISKIGPPNLINCHKCKSCGHSFTS